MARISKEHGATPRVIFVAGRENGRMCGHQHSTPQQADNCGNRSQPVVMVTRGKYDPHTEMRVVTFNVLERTERGTYKRTGVDTW